MYVERVQMEFFYTGGLMRLWGTRGSRTKAQCQVWVTTISVVGIGVNNIDIAIVLGVPPELDGKSLRKTPRQHILESQDIENSSWYWLGNLSLLVACLALEVLMETVGGSKAINSLTHLWTLGATIMSVLARYDQWCFSGMNAMGGIDCFLIGFKV